MTVTTPVDNDPRHLITSDRRLYLDGKGNVVGDDSPDRVTLLAAPGVPARVTPEQAAQIAGLTGSALPGATDTSKDEEIATLKARITELEAELAKKPAKGEPAK